MVMWSRRNAITSIASAIILPSLAHASSTAHTAKHRRVALLIGVSEYKNERLKSLKNAFNSDDFNNISNTLYKLGFDVIPSYNDSTGVFSQKFGKFLDESKNMDIATLFFVGHGGNLSGRDAIFLADADIDQSTSERGNQEIPLPAGVLALSGLLHQVAKQKLAEPGDNAANTTLFFIDACRKNDLNVPGFSQSNQPTDVINFLISYSTVANTLSTAISEQPASSGDATREKSLYLQALFSHIATENISIEEVLSRVARDMQKLPKNIEDKIPGLLADDAKDLKEKYIQTPSYYASLQHPIYLKLRHYPLIVD